MYNSLAEAAKAVGKSKPAILEAIRKGRISAKKNTLGQWEIDPAELHRVYPLNRSEENATERCETVTLHEKEAKIRELQARLEVMERLYEDMKNRAEDLKNERDDWKQQAKALPPGEGRGFWKRLFGG